MANPRSASVTTFVSATTRESRLRAGDPIYIQDTGQDTVPAQQDGRARAFRSSTPIMAAVFDDAADITELKRKYHTAVRHRARRRRIGRFRRLHPKLMHAVPLGLLSVGLYTLLFTNERLVLEMSVGHWWSFMVPVSIALVFSLAHGSFTGAFWDAIGLQPNTIRR